MKTASEDTFETILKRVEILPEFTIPDALIGDKFFPHATAGEDPTVFPASDVFVIQNIISTGDNCTQRFVCVEVE